MRVCFDLFACIFAFMCVFVSLCVCMYISLNSGLFV